MEKHVTVLLHEAIEGLRLKSGATAIDATLGLGGHSASLADSVGPKGTVLGIDADQNALKAAQDRLKDKPAHLEFALGNFRNITMLAREHGIQSVDGILFDLGWNSTQLEAGRGFSFLRDEPLQMTYAAQHSDEEVTARDIVNEWSESDLEEVLRTIGEERFSGRIARAIVDARKEKPIETSLALADVIKEAVPVFYRRGKIHPATKTFQALRIVVNNELSSIEQALPQAYELLAPKGRLAVITFHSIEDGLVKRIFKKFVEEKNAIRIIKKPIVPTREEVVRNPRSRSAKLRIIEKS